MIVDEQAERLLGALAEELVSTVDFPISGPRHAQTVARLIHELICHELQTRTNLGNEPRPE